FLRTPLGTEEVVETAAAGARISATDRRPPLVDGAGARLEIEEPAGAAEDLVLLVPQDTEAAPLGGHPLGDAALGDPDAESGVPRRPVEVAVGDFDVLVGAAVGGVVAAVVLAAGGGHPRILFAIVVLCASAAGRFDLDPVAAAV